MAARGINLLRGHHLRSIEPLADGGYGLGFDTGNSASHSLEADFLVDATGIAAGAVRRLGVARNPIDSLIVVFAVVEHDAPDAIPSHSFLTHPPAIQGPSTMLNLLIFLDNSINLESVTGFDIQLEMSAILGYLYAFHDLLL